MNPCNGCRFCCWSWSVEEISKPCLTHCQYECKKGCEIYMRFNRPTACEEFHCPYQERDGLHRPDKFQKTLESLGGNIGNYIPNIPVTIPVETANRLIRETRTLPVSIINGTQWVDVIMPLDRDESGGWVTADPTPWNA